MSPSRNLEVTSRSDLRPPAPPDATVEQVRLSPNGRRMAFVCDDGVHKAVYACDVGADSAQRLVPLGDAAIDELTWSPSGDHLAYVTGAGLPIGVERSVGWASGSEPGELGRVAGAAVCWGASKPALIVADLTQSALVHVDVATGESVEMGRMVDDGDLHHPPSIAVAHSGKHVAFSCRSGYRDITEVWLLERAADGAEPSLLTQIPGADVSVNLFWSPKGKSLAMNVIHATIEQSAIIAVRGLQGDGEVLHHHDGLDLSQSPAWSPDGKWIAMFCTMGAHEQRLVLLDVQARILQPLREAVPVGSPHFIDETTLAVDGQARATRLELKLS